MKGIITMPALKPQSEVFTMEQYEALPNDVRAEVFDGVLYNMASPSQIHQTILTELLVFIRNYLREKGDDCQVFPAPFDVKLSDRPLTIVQPDIMIVCDKNKLEEKRCNGAPDFIIEIVSPGNPADDYIRKLYYYQNSGVREYWIVDPKRKTVTVNYFEEEIISLVYPMTAVIKVNIYNDLYIDFTEIEKVISP